MRDNRFTPIAIVFVMLLLPLSVYIGGYLALMKPMTLYHFSGAGEAETVQIGREAKYPLESKWLANAFAPVHWLDRHIRPQYWALGESQPVPPNFDIPWEGTIWRGSGEGEITDLSPQ